MEAQNLPDALAMIMQQNDWSQSDLADALGVTQGWVSHVTHGKRDPGIQRAAGYLGRVGWEVRIAPTAGSEDQVDRRNFLLGAASVTLVPSAKLGPFQDPSYIRMLADRLDHMTGEQGGNNLLSSASRYLGHIRPALEASDRELQAASSDLARKISLVLYDSRRLDDAEKVGNFALLLARKSSYGKGIAHSYENLCLFSERERLDPLRGAVYARKGLSIPELTSEQRARLSVRLGTSLSKARSPVSEKNIRRPLDDALSTDGIPTNTTAVILGNAGIALGNLGRYSDASKSLSRAIGLFGYSPLLQAIYLGEQIKLTLRSGNIPVSAEQISEFSRLVPLVSSARVDRYVGEILTLSLPWNTVPEMRTAREQLQGMTHPPA